MYYQFAEGVQCFDSLTESTFTIHAYILSFSGDLPALAKVMCTTGHNSYKGCRFCDIRGIYLRHIYFPTMVPMSDKGFEIYDPLNLPLRTHNQFRNHIHQLNQANTSKEREKLEVEFGMINLVLLCSFNYLLIF